MHIHAATEQQRLDPRLHARRAARPQRRHRGARRRGRRVHAERPVSRRRRAPGRQPHDDRSRQGRTARATSSTRASSAAGRAVFNGKIIVRQDAQKTDAKQTNRALLLSDDAHDQHQAAARDLRRRREVHARRGDRPARRRRDLLPARARADVPRGARHADSRVRRRDPRARARSSRCARALEAELYAQLAKDLAEVDAA